MKTKPLFLLPILISIASCRTPQKTTFVEKAPQVQPVIAEPQKQETASQNPRIRSSSQSEGQYESVLGNLWVGTMLYDKTTHDFFGVVTDASWGKVEVWGRDGIHVTSAGASGPAIWYERDFITKNFVTKKR